MRTLTLTLIKAEYWDRAIRGGNISHGAAEGCMLRDQNDSRHFDQYAALKTIPPSLRSLERHAPPTLPMEPKINEVFSWLCIDVLLS